MRIDKALTVTVYLKKDIKNSEKFCERDEYRSHGAFLGHILIYPESDTSDRYEFSQNTDTPIPEDVVQFVDDIVWSSDLIGFNDKPILPRGVHKGKKGEVIINISCLPGKNSCGSYTIEISAKDLQSLIDIYARIFPKSVLPIFPAD